MIYLAIIVVCLLFVAYREHEHSRERVLLLNRIQAPQLAVAQSIENPEPAVHVGFDNDDDFWEAREELVGRTG